MAFVRGCAELSSTLGVPDPTRRPSGAGGDLGRVGSDLSLGVPQPDRGAVLEIELLQG